MTQYAQFGTHRPKRASENVALLDTTLREGEQARGIQFNRDQKLAIAQAIDGIGIDYLEVGHPAAAPAIAADARAIARQNLRAQTVAHARAIEADVEAAAAAEVDWVGIFFSVTDAAMEARFRRDEAACTALIVRAIETAKAHGLRVRYTPEDTVRADPAVVARVAAAAVAAGADRIALADTTGCMTPDGMAARVQALASAPGVHVPLHAHCHNDLGLATANALAAFDAGAQVADVSVLGLGERAGITDLAQLATALTTQGIVAPERYHLARLPALYDLVAEAAGIAIPAWAPLVGRNAFSHNAGLHVSAVLVDPAFYESVPAHLVGRDRHIVIDRLSGQAAVAHRLTRLGREATREEVTLVLDVVKARGLNDIDDATLETLHDTVRMARAPAAPEVMT